MRAIKPTISPAQTMPIFSSLSIGWKKRTTSAPSLNTARKAVKTSAIVLPVLALLSVLLFM